MDVFRKSEFIEASSTSRCKLTTRFIDDMTTELMAEINRGKTIVYNTYQLYRHDRLEYLKHEVEVY